MAADVLTADTSVVIALLARWHVFHEVAKSAARAVTRLPSHVELETVAGLTTMPGGRDASAQMVVAALRSRFPTLPLAMTEADGRALIEIIAEFGLRGGQVYDAVVAATAKAAGARLLSFDRRAERTYRVIGVDYQLLGRGLGS